MNLEEILGRREDQRLEFKSADALAEDLERVARAVAGMLNATGGEIWIGVDEEDEAPVAINPVANPERARRRLWDYLVETMDPAPLPGEVVIDLEPIQQDRAVLVVRIQPPEPSNPRLPFAFRKKGGWYFVRRIGARNHPMAREEIFAGTVAAPYEDSAANAAIDDLLALQGEFRDSGRDGLWMCLRPARRDLVLDPGANRDRFEQFAVDPTATNNGRTGRHFAQSRRSPQLVKDGIRWEAWSDFFDQPRSSVDVRDDGVLTFWASIWALHRGEEHEIGPREISEYPVSALRIAREIYRTHLSAGDKVAVGLALFDLRDWKLRPGTPGDHDFRLNEPAKMEASDLVLRPRVLAYADIDSAPDRCGFDLVRRVYQAFGFGEEDMPRQFDRETGRLLLPE